MHQTLGALSTETNEKRECSPSGVKDHDVWLELQEIRSELVQWNLGYRVVGPKKREWNVVW